MVWCSLLLFVLLLLELGHPGVDGVKLCRFNDEEKEEEEEEEEEEVEREVIQMSTVSHCLEM